MEGVAEPTYLWTPASRPHPSPRVGGRPLDLPPPPGRQGPEVRLCVVRRRRRFVVEIGVKPLRSVAARLEIWLLFFGRHRERGRCLGDALLGAARPIFAVQSSAHPNAVLPADFRGFHEAPSWCVFSAFATLWHGLRPNIRFPNTCERYPLQGKRARRVPIVARAGWGDSVGIGQEGCNVFQTGHMDPGPTPTTPDRPQYDPEPRRARARLDLSKSKSACFGLLGPIIFAYKTLGRHAPSILGPVALDALGFTPVYSSRRSAEDGVQGIHHGPRGPRAMLVAPFLRGPLL